MTSLLAKLWSKFGARKNSYSIMLVGLDNGGKTSILQQMNSPALGTNQQFCGNASTSSSRTSCDQLPSISGDLSDFDEPEFSTERSLMLDAPYSASEFAASSFELDSTAPGSGENLRLELTSAKSVTQPTIGYSYEKIHLRGLAITVLDFSGQSKYRCLWAEFYSSVDAIVFVIDSSDLIRFVVVRDELESLLAHPYFATLDQQNPYPNTAPALAISFVQKQLYISQGKLVQSPLDMTPQSNSLVDDPIARQSQPNITMTRDADQRNKKARRCRTQIPILFIANKCDLPNSVDTEVIIKALNLNQITSERHPWHIQATSISTGEGIREAFDWLSTHLYPVNTR